MSDPSKSLDELARGAYAELTASAERTRLPAKWRRVLRGAGRGIVRKGKEVVQEHWDVALFDVFWGSLKAFAIYPALYFASLTWTIPILEWGPLNTQLWTGGYLLLRRQSLSALGRRRYGVSLNEMDAYRDQVLGMDVEDVRSFQRFEVEGQQWRLRVRRNRLLQAWRRLRSELEPNVLTQSELRGLIQDPGFLDLAARLRHNAPLYERVLVQRLLAEPHERRALLSKLEPVSHPEEGLLARERVIGEQRTLWVVSRVVAAGDRLVERLRVSLGGRFSAMSLALRWVYWSYQRHIYGLEAKRQRKVYALLANELSQDTPDPTFLAELEHVQQESQAWIEAMEAFGGQAEQVTGPQQAALVIDEGIREARRRGLSVRLARFARWASPTLRRLREQPEALLESPDWARLERSEAELEEAWNELVTAGFGATEFRRRLEKKETPEAFRDRLETGVVAQADFLARLDVHLRALHQAHVREVQSLLSRAVGSLWLFYGESRSRPLRRRAQKIAALGERYQERESLYGTPQDHLRIVTFQRFHAEAVALARDLRSLDPTAPPVLRPALTDRLARWIRGLGVVFKRASHGVRLLREGVGLLRVAFGSSAGPGTPFTRRVDGVFGALGRVLGLEVEVIGSEILEDEVPEGTVRLLVPAHRHGVTDNITFASLGLPHYWAFNAVDQLPALPRFLKDRIAKAPGLIPVGGGRGSAVERAVEVLSGPGPHQLLIYPEGSVSEGLRATRPPRTGFGEGLIPALHAAGHDVQLNPVTYLDNARFLDLPDAASDEQARRRRVVVSPPLPPGLVRSVVDLAGGEAINGWVRLAWLECLTTDETSFLGAERVASLRARTERELEGLRYWGSTEAKPSPQRLETGCGENQLLVREEPFHGKRIRVFQWPEDAVDDSGAIPVRGLAEPNGSELILGIRDPAHIYLNVGRQRFDGDIFRPLRVRVKETIYPGIAIRFLEVPDQAVEAIRRQLEQYAGRERRTLTCAHSACQVIGRAASLRIDDHGEWRPLLPSHILPTRTMRKLIEKGVVDHAGRRIPIEIYTSDDRPLQEVLAQMRRNEIQIFRDHVDLMIDAIRSRLFGTSENG